MSTSTSRRRASARAARALPMKTPRSRSTSRHRRPTIRNVGTAKYPEVAANAIAITPVTRKERAAAQIQLRRIRS